MARTPAAPIEAQPEQLLAVAVIQRAMADTIAGDVDALAWLRTQAAPWLSIVCPSTVEPDDVLRRILRRVDP